MPRSLYVVWGCGRCPKAINARAHTPAVGVAVNTILDIRHCCDRSHHAAVEVNIKVCICLLALVEVNIKVCI